MTEADIRSFLKTVAPTIDWDSVGADDDLADAGLDSLDKASLIMDLEAAAGVKIDDARYDELATISDLLKAAGGPVSGNVV